jgi:membrane peptidoglycan carboxypeptidase
VRPRLPYFLPARRLIAAIVIISLIVVSAIYYRPLGSRAITGAADLVVTAKRPPTLIVPPLPGVTRLVTSNGQLLAVFAAQSQIPKTLNQIAPVLLKALIASEDRTFYTNDGVDARGILRATFDDLVHHSGQGGSTLTQQYVKNLLVAEYGVAYGDASTLSRKIREVAYATDMNRLLTKDQILEGYLNTVNFGQGAYGIGAASQRYFGVPAIDLSTDQSALLVALLRSPTNYNPLSYPAAALVERNAVLTAMVSDRVLSSSQSATYQAEPLGVHITSLSHGCLTSINPYFCDWVSSTLLTLPELGATPAARLSRLDAGGLTITTTLNPKLQSEAQAAVISKVGYKSPIGSSIVMIRPGTGAVLSMANNRVYGLSTRENETTLNYATATDPVGSTMKLFTLTAALEEGTPLTTILPGGAEYHSLIFNNPPGGYFTNAEPYDPTNIDLATATALSVNTAFVQLEEKVGVLAIANVARDMGLPIPTKGPLAPTSREGSFTLGARSFSPVEMANAYATIAADGRYCAPRGVTSITFPGADTVPVAPDCYQAVPATVASAVTGLLTGVVQYGTGVAAAVAGHPLVGKTGTTSNFGAAWFDGFTPQLAAAAWVGNPLGPSHPLDDIDGVSEVFGGTLPAEEFSLAMTPALENTPPWQIPAPTEAYLVTPHLSVPDLIGLRASTARRRLGNVGLLYRGPSTGVVTATSPSSGTPTAPGQTVTVTIGPW